MANMKLLSCLWATIDLSFLASLFGSASSYLRNPDLV